MGFNVQCERRFCIDYGKLMLGNKRRRKKFRWVGLSTNSISFSSKQKQQQKKKIFSSLPKTNGCETLMKIFWSRNWKKKSNQTNYIRA
jgi:hypothetical protein